jgi:hypothetical protein
MQAQGAVSGSVEDVKINVKEGRYISGLKKT